MVFVSRSHVMLVYSVKLAEETFDAIKVVDSLVLAGARICSRLGTLGVKIGRTMRDAVN